MLLVAAQPGNAQRLLKIWYKMLSPKGYLDSTWIYQQPPRFDVSTGYKAQWNGVGLFAPLTLDKGEAGGTPIKHDMVITLVNHMSHSIGFHGGYGPINLGFSISLGPKDKRNKTYSFNWIQSYYGAQFYYGRFSEQVSASVNSQALPKPSYSDVRFLRADAYYAFNRKKFSYKAAYKERLTQRKSAGSIMAAVKYMHSNIVLDRADDNLMRKLYGMCGYGTHQAAIGAGYSFNFVPYHKDDVSNVTINLTAIPMVSFVNEIGYTTFDKDKGEIKTNIHGKVQPTLMSSAAVSYTVGHFHFCASVDFQYNMFSTNEIVKSSKELGQGGKTGVPPGCSIRYFVTGHYAHLIGEFKVHYTFSRFRRRPKN